MYEQNTDTAGAATVVTTASIAPCWSNNNPSRNLQQTLDQQHLYSRSVDCVNDSTHCDAGAVADRGIEVVLRQQSLQPW
jgi:hypothetical protein